MNKNFDPSVDGIIVQLPVPDKYDVDMICNTIIKEKDADGYYVVPGKLDKIGYALIAFFVIQCIILALI